MIKLQKKGNKGRETMSLLDKNIFNKLMYFFLYGLDLYFSTKIQVCRQKKFMWTYYS